jgi:hypothetical protein
MPEWQELYKKFVHPAGFHLGAEIIFQEPAKLFKLPQPVVQFDLPAFIIDDIASISNNFLYDSLGSRTVEDTFQLLDITQLTTMGDVSRGYTQNGRGYNGAAASGPTGPIYNVRLHVLSLKDNLYLNRTISSLIAGTDTTYSWAAQSREVWNTTTDDATLIRSDSAPSILYLRNGVDSYGYHGTYPAFYSGTGDNPDYMKTPYPSIITTSLAYQELGASHFAADSDMTQEYPLYDSDVRH